VIDPFVIGTVWIERLVRGKRDAGGIFAEEGIGVIKAVNALFVGNVGSPEADSSRAVLVNPTGNLVENVSAELPCFQV